LDLDETTALAPVQDDDDPARWYPGKPLHPIENELLRRSAPFGELLDRGAGPYELDVMQGWGVERTIRADVLRYLLMEGEYGVSVKGVRLRGIRISGELDLQGGPMRCQLRLTDCYLDSAKPVCLDHVTASVLDLTGCHMPGLSGELLTADEMDIRGSTLTGPLTLMGANIRTQLVCSDANFEGKDDLGYSLQAFDARIGDVLLDNATTEGGVSFAGAEITGFLSCDDATLGKNIGGQSISASPPVKAGTMSLRGMEAAGSVDIGAAEIARQLLCTDTKLGTDNEGRSLMASMIVATDAFLDGDFATQGAIRLDRARLSRSLSWVPSEQIQGSLNLTNATVGELLDYWSRDRPNGNWPGSGRLSLDGFTYDWVGRDTGANEKDRLSWIRSQYAADSAKFSTQPYEQIAAIYRQTGQDAAARRIAIARRVDLRRYGDLTPLRKISNWLLYTTIRYGYATWRAGVALCLLYVAVAGLALVARDLNLVVPVGNIQGLSSVPVATHCTASYPCFYPAGYAIDTMIPIIDVHQAGNWGINGSAPWGWIWVTGTWIATGLGWALATLLVAGYTGIVRQQ
jgi:hypothetical protein